MTISHKETHVNCKFYQRKCILRFPDSRLTFIPPQKTRTESETNSIKSEYLFWYYVDSKRSSKERLIS